MKKLILILTISLLSGCSSMKTYESKVFPTGEWKPVNFEYFGKNEAQRILEGGLHK